MKITYIGHSGFLAETKNCYYLFDYYKGALPQLLCEKPILVFASHAHPDHYNRKIFDVLSQMGMRRMTAILSKDISPKMYPEETEVLRVTLHQQYDLPWGTTLHTLQSTDAGVAFLVTCEEGILYHSGDLNDWTWDGESEQENKQMTGNFRHEIEYLRTILEGKQLDAAFFPLDPRLEDNYAKGLLYFLKKIPVKALYPMHYWDQPEVISRFVSAHLEYASVIQNTEGCSPFS